MFPERRGTLNLKSGNNVNRTTPVNDKRTEEVFTHSKPGHIEHSLG